MNVRAQWQRSNHSHTCTHEDNTHKKKKKKKTEEEADGANPFRYASMAMPFILSYIMNWTCYHALTGYFVEEAKTCWWTTFWREKKRKKRRSVNNNAIRIYCVHNFFFSLHSSRLLRGSRQYGGYTYYPFFQRMKNVDLGLQQRCRQRARARLQSLNSSAGEHGPAVAQRSSTVAE